MKYRPNLSKANLGIKSNNNYIFTSNLFSSENQGLNKKITGLLDYYILRIYWFFLSNSFYVYIGPSFQILCF